MEEKERKNVVYNDCDWGFLQQVNKWFQFRSMSKCFVTWNLFNRRQVFSRRMLCAWVESKPLGAKEYEIFLNNRENEVNFVIRPLLGFTDDRTNPTLSRKNPIWQNSTCHLVPEGKVVPYLLSIWRKIHTAWLYTDKYRYNKGICGSSQRGSLPT